MFRSLRQCVAARPGPGRAPLTARARLTRVAVEPPCRAAVRKARVRRNCVCACANKDESPGARGRRAGSQDDGRTRARSGCCVLDPRLRQDQARSGEQGKVLHQTDCDSAETCRVCGHGYQFSERPSLLCGGLSPVALAWPGVSESFR